MRLISLTKKSIRLRLIFAFVTVILAIIVTISVYQYSKQHSRAKETAKTHITSLTDMLAFTAGVGLSEGNFQLIEAAFNWAKGDDQVIYIAILDEEKSKLIEYNPEEQQLDAIVQSDKTDSELNNRLFLKASVTADGISYGQIILGYSLEHVNAQLQNDLFWQFILFLVTGGLAMLAVVYLANAITGQIISLRNAMKRFSEGENDVAINIYSEDEIGELAAEFSNLIEKVNSTSQELLTEKASVEQKVDEAIRESESQKEYLTSSVEEILDKMERFANGDLTVNLEVNDPAEIGRLYKGFNLSVENIRQMLHNVREVVVSTVDAAKQINQATEELSVGLNNQSGKVHTVAASMEEMTQTIVENSSNAKKTAESAQQNGKLAKNGGEIILQTIAKINVIADVVKTSGKTVEKLGETSSEIDSIVSAIDEIADQTNLLALNAA
ncbi:MAG: HAMP domain-containing protein, partial [Calditrichaeota bacterium]|nr:HAMP domain-containing protein [Calditrichota bacterium]